MTSSTALNESRRAAELAALADGEPLDVFILRAYPGRLRIEWTVLFHQPVYP